MNENKELTEKEKDYYQERITVKLIPNEKTLMVVCKKCGESLIPFEKDTEKEKVDKALSEHNCKENGK